MKKAPNFLHFTPEIKSHIRLIKKGKLTAIQYDRDTPLQKLLVFMFHLPETITVDLDEFGSFIISQIDGTRTIGEISLLVKETFGEKAEPLIPRLVEFMKMLKKSGFVRY